MAKYDIGSKLTDPTGVCADNPELFQELSKKITNCLTRLFRLPEGGGNPFLFALANTKNHELAPDLPNLGFPFKTAATDGKKYYWSAEFLEKLNVDETATVMQHESYHIVFFHPDKMARHEDKKVCNWAIDYVVNTIIWTDHENIRKNVPIWGGNLGEPISLKELLAWIDGTTEINEDVSHIFADKTLLGRAAESIYDEIMRHKANSPRKCKKCGALNINPKTKKPHPPGPCTDYPTCQHQGMCCPVCGALPNSMGGHSGEGGLDALDAHMPAAVTKQDIMTDLMRAAQQAIQMRGSVPSSVKDVLGELEKPVVSAKDIIRAACMKKVQEAGLQNNYKRYRRRYLPRPGYNSGGYKGQYLPTRHSHLPRWLAMLDTSGSMSDADLVFGVSQLQCLGDTEGYVIPCDAAVHWEGITKIEKAADLAKTKIVGRGGTVFDDFFRDFPKKIGKDFDVIVVLTDGDCGIVPMQYKPPMEVVWIITRKTNQGYKPSFGRVVPLRLERIVPS
jgi:predicted metal-dependent peptidase